MPEKIDLKRARPERSKKRKLTLDGLTRFEIQISEQTLAKLKKEASALNASASLYINAIIETRDQKKIKKTLTQ